MPDFPICEQRIQGLARGQSLGRQQDRPSGTEIAILAIEDSLIKGSELVLDGHDPAGQIEIQHAHPIFVRWIAVRLAGYGWRAYPKEPFPVATNILPYGFAGLLTSPAKPAPPIQIPPPLPLASCKKHRSAAVSRHCRKISSRATDPHRSRNRRRHKQRHSAGAGRVFVSDRSG